jgi:hypothetical protein
MVLCLTIEGIRFKSCRNASLPRLSQPGSPFFPHVGWTSRARELRELPNKPYPLQTSSQHNRSPSLHIGSFSIRSIPVCTTKHPHDCTESTTLQASNGQHGTSINFLVRYESSSILRVLFRFHTQSILTILRFTDVNGPHSLLHSSASAVSLWG